MPRREDNTGDGRREYIIWMPLTLIIVDRCCFLISLRTRSSVLKASDATPVGEVECPMLTPQRKEHEDVRYGIHPMSYSLRNGSTPDIYGIQNLNNDEAVLKGVRLDEGSTICGSFLHDMRVDA